MRRILMTGIAVSSSMMMMLGYQNCTKKETRVAKTKIHYVDATHSPN